MEVDHPLVDPQLEPVPGLGTLTARGLPGGDPQGLGGHPHWALDLQLLLLGSLDQVGADLLQTLDGTRGQGDPDPVDHLLLAGATFAILVSRLKREKTTIKYLAKFRHQFYLIKTVNCVANW